MRKYQRDLFHTNWLQTQHTRSHRSARCERSHWFARFQNSSLVHVMWTKLNRDVGGHQMGGVANQRIGISAAMGVQNTRNHWILKHNRSFAVSKFAVTCERSSVCANEVMGDAEVKLGADLRSGTSSLRSIASNTRSCTSELRSGTFLLGFTAMHSLYLSIFLYAWCFVKKCSPSRSFCYLHLSMLGVDRCCKHQTLFKCRKSQTECLECSKTPGRRSGTPPLLSALRARASALQASRL